MPQLALVAAGGIIGGSVAGTIGVSVGTAVQFGMMAGSLLGSALFAPHTDVTSEGPRLTDLNVQISSYGAAIPVGFGTFRFSGNVIQKTDLIEHKAEHDETVGGKGKPSQTNHNISYSYTCTWAVMLGRKLPSQTPKILRVWFDKELVWDVTGAGAVANGVTFRFYDGSDDQMPDPALQTLVGVDSCPAYRGRIYMVFADQDVTKWGHLPQVEVEMSFDGTEAYPKFGPADGADHLGVDNLLLDPYRPYLYAVWGPWVQRYNRATCQLEQEVNFEETYGWSPSAYDAMCVDEQGFLYLCGTSDTYSPFWKIDVYTLTPVKYFGATTDLSTGEGGGGSGLTPATVTHENSAVLRCFDDPIHGQQLCSVGIRGEVMLLGRGLDGDPVFGAPYPGTYLHRPTNLGTRYAMAPDKYGDCWIIENGDAGEMPAETWLTRVELSAGITVSYVGDIIKRKVWCSNYDLTAYIAHAASVWYCASDHSLIIGTDYGRNDNTAPNPITYGFIKYDLTTMTKVAELRLPFCVIGRSCERNPIQADGCFMVGADAGHWLKVRASDLQLVASYQISNWHPVGIPVGFVYDGQYNSVWVAGQGDTAIWRYALDRATGNGPTLASVVAQTSELCGLNSEDIDVTGLLAKTVRGYIINSQGGGRAALAPLLSAYFFDGVESDWKMKFPLRGGAPVATILEDDLGQANQSDPLQEHMQQEIELPLRLTIRYPDPVRDYNIGAQSYKRVASPFPTIHTAQNVSIDAPLVLIADEAKQIAERTLYEAWVGRMTYDPTVLPKYMRLDPTDVALVNYEDHQYKLRMGPVALGAGYALALQAVAEDPEVYLSTATGSSGDGFVGQTITQPGATILILMDTPLLLDSHDGGGSQSGYYFGVGAFSDAWRGAVIYKSDDGSEYAPLTVVDKQVTWGRSLTLLPSVPNWATWDRASRLTVKLTHGELSSVSELDVLNGRNTAYLGGEILQFANATPTGNPDEYVLDTFLRGRRGTDGRFTHAIGENFVLLNPATGYRQICQTSEIGLKRYLRPVTLGGLITSAPTTELILAGNDLKPYAPASVEATRDGDGNLTVTWARRTRVGGTWVDGSGLVPLSEETEAYSVEIMDGATVKRTLAVSSPTATYTAAQQTEDFGAPQTSLTVRIYQLSAVVRRGFAAEKTL